MYNLTEFLLLIYVRLITLVLTVLDELLYFIDTKVTYYDLLLSRVHYKGRSAYYVNV